LADLGHLPDFPVIKRCNMGQMGKNALKAANKNNNCDGWTLEPNFFP